MMWRHERLREDSGWLQWKGLALVEVQRGQVMLATTLTPAQLAAARSLTIRPGGVDNDNGYQRRASTSAWLRLLPSMAMGPRSVGRVFEDRRGLMPNPIIANIRQAAGR